MYQPGPHREDDRATLHALIEARPLGLLARQGADGLVADHVPFLLDVPPDGPAVLRAHVARANPLWREADGREVLVVFHDPGVYITPSFYPSKREHGKVVPTWNYVAVHAHGTLRAIEDRAWLRKLVEDLTLRHEAPEATPWRVGDAPYDFIDRMLRAIVGIEIPIARIEGKWKVSQNRTDADRDGVAAGLRARGDEASARMADLVDGARNK